MKRREKDFGNARNYFWLWLTAVITMITLAACGNPLIAVQETERMPDGDAQRGAQLLQDYGCGACHTIPGIPGADATVGPPLDNWAHRHYIAGTLTNTADNLVIWLKFPQTIEPGTAMPNLNVTDQDARDMGAYLYTLKE